MEQRTISSLPRSLIFAAIFMVILVTHVASPMTNPTDTIWVLPTALSIVRKGTPDLTEYLPSRNDYRIECVGNKAYQRFPIGVPLLSVPFVYFIDKLLHVTDWEIDPFYNYEVMKIIASIVIALACVFMYLIAETYLSPVRSVAVVFVFAYCTPVWSTASRAL